jgi:LL-diaminopimelate aminotransferase
VQAATKVTRNPNMGKLQAGYLFPEINRIKGAHITANPDAKIISLGIGGAVQVDPKLETIWFQPLHLQVCVSA